MIILKGGVPTWQFEKIHWHTRTILERAAELAWCLYRCDLMITSIYRDDNSTHSNLPPYRFVDASTLERGSSELIRSIINKEFPRTDGKETVPRLDHGTAPHFHFQSQPEQREAMYENPRMA